MGLFTMKILKTLADDYRTAKRFNGYIDYAHNDRPVTPRVALEKQNVAEEKAAVRFAARQSKPTGKVKWKDPYAKAPRGLPRYSMLPPPMLRKKKR